ncbi:multi-sensor signal transduction histidine kinase [Alkaliphilus metalliredigens QYMF]|uniref:histidine kinase n=1 Tax=Alkaliphilus metalliredigens (strain QYMF) TaxID=293826 RepID=A6TMR3_ALKMQ|nr:ATP-binding protein [Alkaliphilus metalliredigens]ABR47481.1 multi-sensor signal transduction histidine kinase [Alkaliphilus metalliredigens QYMF]
MNGIGNKVCKSDKKARNNTNKKLKFIRHFSNDKKVALKITSIYVLISFLYVFLSDKVIRLLIKDLKTITRYLTIKGSFFIIFTASLMYFLIYKNIKRVRTLQEEVLSYGDRYKLVLNNTTDGFWDYNLLTNEVVLPLKWKNSLGYEDDEIPNTVDAWKNFIHPEDFNWVTQTLYDYINGKIPRYNIEYRMIKRDGGIIWIQDKGQAIWGADGKAIQICGTHTDITFRKESEEIKSKIMDEKQQLLVRALEQEKLQAEFFSNISHEFKTPLNVILGTVQLVEHYNRSNLSELEPRQLNKCIHIMKQNCYRLLRLINNLIDITKLDFDSFSIKYKNYNVIHILEEITQSTVALAEIKGISITFDTDVEEKIIACDINILERIMLNLISNAIKYSEVGSDINVMVCGQEESLLISVKDTGMGIPENQLSAIFDRFVQIDDSLPKKTEGSGIGLSLVKEFVEKLNGEISVKSKVDYGSEFVIKLPVEVLVEESIELNSHDYGKNLIEKINIELSDIYFSQ